MAEKREMVGVEDMIRLDHLHETSILDNLFLRFNHDLIYTYTGSILVAVNPYQELAIYTPSIASLYEAAGADILDLPPHVFAIADLAYVRMRSEGKNQSILISGESGSGKTESTKLILRYLATRNNRHSRVEQSLLEISPILESFGNAKTVRNDNSSRFGKFIEVCFGTEAEGLKGARVVQYLLEKSRIVGQAEGERNYHIFYQMLAGMSSSEKAALKLGPATSYAYLNSGGCCTINSVDDADDFHSVMAAFEYLDISREEQQNVLKVIAAVLHLGNTEFSKSANSEEIQCKDEKLIEFVASLLNVAGAQLKSALTKRQLNIRNTVTVTALQLHEVIDVRDALAKALYGNLFKWIVRTINSKIDPPSCECSIGILDIFGFENFKVNSFEQLCINYCNEKLQQHFNQHIFKLEQQEYMAEGINWSKVDFVDNQDTLTLIERKPLGVLAIVDEECRFPQATDTTLLDKLHKNCVDSNKYEKPRVAKSSFGISHYAGSVKYEVEGFLAKNRDTLPLDLMELMSGSSNTFIVDLFSDKYMPAMPETTIRRGTKSFTVGFQFKEQLNELMMALAATNPSFIRCVKPNAEKVGSVFDKELVTTQLRYSGMLETVRIRKAGFGMRYPFSDFFHRYKVLHPALVGQKDQPERLCDVLCKHLSAEKILEDGEWVMGKTKVFLRDRQHNKLEERRIHQFTKATIVIQKVWRMYSVRDFYFSYKESTLLIQTNRRRQVAQHKFNIERKAALALQTYFRAKQQKFKYKKLLLGLLSTSASRAFLMRKQYFSLVTEKRKREEDHRKKIEKERKQKEKEEQKRREEEAKKKKEEEEKQKKLLEQEQKRKQKEEEQRKKEEEQRKKDEKKQKKDKGKSKEAPTSPRKEDEKQLQIQREEVADAEAKAQQKREVEALQRAGEDMSFKKQEAAAMLAASKRIVNRASVTLNQPPAEIKNTTSSSSNTPNNNEGNPQATPERTRRSFVLSASSNRRSRSKTSPMIVPIDDVDKFIRENQEEEESGSTNVRRTLMFRKASLPNSEPNSPRQSPSRVSVYMTAKPLSLSLGADRQSLAQAEIGTVYSQLLAKKKVTYPTLNRRTAALPQSPIYYSCSMSKIGGNFVNANIVTPQSSKTKIPVVLLEKDASLMETFIANNVHTKYQKALSFSQKPLKAPLLKTVTGEGNKQALQANDLILTYMNDKKGAKGITSTLQQWLNVQDLLRIGLNNKTAIRSEIYLQIYKQINQNTNLLHVISGWELLTYCACTFAPDIAMQQAMVGVLLDIIYSSAPQLHENQFAEWAQISLDALRKSLLFGDRKFLPSLQELEAIKTQTIISIPVFFLDTTEKDVNISSFTTSQDVCDEIMSMVGIDTIHLKEYSLYEVSGDYERSLWPDERICDIIAKWEIYKKSVAGTGVAVSFAFLFKQQIYLMDEKVEIADVSILGYHQGVANVVNDTYLVTSEDVVLALSALQITYDPMTPMTACIPRSMFHKHSADEWEELVNKKSSLMNLRNVSPNKARSLYNSYIRELPYYGCTVFPVKDSSSKRSVLLAVNVYGFHVLDPVAKEIEYSFTFTQFDHWEFNNTTFSVRLHANYIPTAIPSTFSFSTVQGVEIAHLLEKYSHIMKAFPYPYVLIVPHPALPTAEAVKVGEVVRVVARDNGNVTVVVGPHSTHVQIPLPICLPCIDPALSLSQAGNFEELTPNAALALSPSVAKIQEHDYGHFLAVISTLPTVDPHRFSFYDFSDIHFRQYVKNKEKRAVFSKDKIDSSLLPLDNNLSNAAVKAFSSILKYCGLRTTSTFDARTLAQSVIQTIIDEPELRDEVYCQLIKQTTLCPKRAANKKAWELIAIAIGCVTPTELLLDYFVAYIQENSKLVDADYVNLVRVAQARLAATLTNPTRTLCPTFYEINCVAGCVPFYCEVATPDDVVHKIVISCNTTVKDLLAKMAEKLNVSQKTLQGYELYARIPDKNSLFQNKYTKLGTLCSLKHDRAIPDIWRLLEKFHNELAQQKKVKDKEASPVLTPSLLMQPLKLRRRTMIDSSVPENHVVATLEAAQGAHDLFSGKYPATPLEATNLAALYLQFTYADYMASNPVVTVKNIKQFVAPYIYRSGGLDVKQWTEALTIAYASLAGKSAQDSRVQFLRNLRNWPLYGASLFKVKLRQTENITLESNSTDEDDEPDEDEGEDAVPTAEDAVWLAIHKSGIDVLKFPDFTPVRTIPISLIAGWAYVNHSFNVTIGSLRKPVKLFFYTPEAQEIDLVVRNYIELLTGNSPQATKTHQGTQPAIRSAPARNPSQASLIPSPNVARKSARILPPSPEGPSANTTDKVPSPTSSSSSSTNTSVSGSGSASASGSNRMSTSRRVGSGSLNAEGKPLPFHASPRFNRRSSRLAFNFDS